MSQKMMGKKRDFSILELECVSKVSVCLFIYLSILSVKCLANLPKIRNNPDGVTADDDHHNVDSDTRELHLAFT